MDHDVNKQLQVLEFATNINYSAFRIVWNTLGERAKKCARHRLKEDLLREVQLSRTAPALISSNKIAKVYESSEAALLTHLVESFLTDLR